MTTTITTLSRHHSLASPPVTSRSRQLTDTLHNLHQRFGQNALIKLGEVACLEVDVIPTGMPTLDEALGVGGLPRGRIVDVVGPESSGKTTLCLQVIAEAQRQGGIGVFVDTEHALDLAYARRCGVDIENLYISQPNSGEEALEIVEALVRVGVDVVVVCTATASGSSGR